MIYKIQLLTLRRPFSSCSSFMFSVLDVGVIYWSLGVNSQTLNGNLWLPSNKITLQQDGTALSL